MFPRVSLIVDHNSSKLHKRMNSYDSLTSSLINTEQTHGNTESICYHARGKFGEHKESLRNVPSASESNPIFLSVV